MKEIKARSERDGTFMKAPNGKQSNLNERNWLLVRTKEFKQWFGDWIKNGYICKENYTKNDEFRRLQESSAGLGSEVISEYHLDKRRITGETRQRLSGIFRQQLESTISSGSNRIRSGLTSEKHGTSFDFIEEINPQLFHDIFEIVRNYLPNGELVDLHDDYSNIRCYISTDGLSGFAIESDGNIISVFNLSGKSGFLYAIKDYIIELGADHLDGYNSSKQPLAEIYEKALGWHVASMMDYNMEYDHDNIAENHGKPQVAFMVATDKAERKDYDKDSYEAAQEHQLSFVPKKDVSKVVDENGEPQVRFSTEETKSSQKENPRDLTTYSASPIENTAEVHNNPVQWHNLSAITRIERKSRVINAIR